MRLGRRWLTAGLLSVTLLSATAVPAVARTVVRPLPTLPNEIYGGVNDINDSGVIVGYVQGRAVKWTPDGRVTDLGGLPGKTDHVATGINNSGTIVGVSFLPGGGPSSASRWAPDGTIKALASAPGYPDCVAMAINDSGMIAGHCGVEYESPRAVRWNPDGSIVLLAMPQADRLSHAVEINSSGVIIGSSSLTYYGKWTATQWNPDGSVARLANLPGGVHSEARGINDNGQIAGSIKVDQSGNTVEHAVRWNSNGTVTALPPANADDQYGGGYAISPDGTVVGQTRNPFYVAATWSPNGTLTILPGLGSGSGSGSYAGVINKYHQIAGTSDGRPVGWRGAKGVPCTVKPFCGS